MSSRLKAGDGFTIVETMIVLAISALMFALAISAVNGKQQQASFQTGIDTLQSQLNLLLKNVGDGNYPVADNVRCTAIVTGGQPSNSGISDGTCDLVGEVLSFGINGTSRYSTYPVFGRTYEAQSTLVATNIAGADPSIFNGVNQDQTMPFGLSIVTPGGTPPGLVIDPSGIGAVGIFSFTSFPGQGSYTDGQLNSGSSHVEIFPLPGSAYAAVPSVNDLTDLSSVCGLNNVCTNNVPATNIEPINPEGGINFCVESGTNTQSAMFTIGGLNNPDTATYKIYGDNNTDCT